MLQIKDFHLALKEGSFEGKTKILGHFTLIKPLGDFPLTLNDIVPSPKTSGTLTKKLVTHSHFLCSHKVYMLYFINHTQCFTLKTTKTYFESYTINFEI